MSSDPNDRSDLPDAPSEPAEPSQPVGTAPEEAGAVEPEQAADSVPQTPQMAEAAGPERPAPAPPETDSEAAGQPPRRRILIGSQRDAAAYRPRPKRDAIPVVGPKPRARRASEQGKKKPEPETAVAHQAPSGQDETPAEAKRAPEPPGVVEVRTESTTRVEVEDQMAALEESATADGAVFEEVAVAEPDVAEAAPPARVPGKKFPPPNIRDRLPPDLEDEFQEALGDVPLEELIGGEDAVTKQAMLEADSQHTGRVVMVRREDVFVELGGREQGVLPLKQFSEPPEPGAEVPIRVVRFNREEGLYELTRPGAAAHVGDWSELEEGMVVEARVTGHNTGGLECEVNHLRGFIPLSQISLYRVENPAELVDEKLTCLVTECNPERRNLVLSRRALLEREQEEARQSLLDSLEAGQIREGVVRKLVDFGAFVDLGGVDGLLHVSQLAWGRVNHPSEVLQEGQAIKVKVQAVDKAAKRISLAYRDLLDNPWTDVEMKYPVNAPARGKVTKLMEYGAFVELEPGVEGLVHVSELSHKRVWRVSDVVSEGEEIDVMVRSVDTEAQRISLSMKGLIPEPKPAGTAEKEESAAAKEPAPPPKPKKQPSKPLVGGLGRAPGGGKFGLKW